MAIPPVKRIFKGIEVVVRKQFTNEIWAQLSYLGSSLTGNYDGAIRQSDGQTDPGINSDYDYAEFTRNFSGRLQLDRPNQGRLDAVYNATWGLSAGVQFYVRTGQPTSELGYFNSGYGSTLYNTQRGYAGRLPTDYEMNLSVGYNLNVGPVTITPVFYAFQLLNRQTITTIDQRFNPNVTFVEDPTSPYYGQSGVQPGTAGPVRERLSGGGARSLHRQPGLSQGDGSDQRRGSSAWLSRSPSRRGRFDSVLRGAASAAPFLRDPGAVSRECHLTQAALGVSYVVV